MKFSELTKPELDEIIENANFTDEELRIFKLLVGNMSLEQISQRLMLSKATVSRRVKDIKIKIEVTIVVIICFFLVVLVVVL